MDARCELRWRLARPAAQAKMLADLADIREELENERLALECKLVRKTDQIDGIDVIVGMTQVSSSDLLAIRNLL